MIYEYGAALERGLDFSGRSTRSEFWLCKMSHYLILLFLFAICRQPGISVLPALYVIAMFIPLLSLTIRRLHDIDKSGWNLLWGIMPIFGWAILLYFYCRASDPNSNRFDNEPPLQTKPTYKSFSEDKNWIDAAKGHLS